MRRTTIGLDFENPLLELEDQIEALQSRAHQDPALLDELRQLRRQWAETVEARLRPTHTVATSEGRDGTSNVPRPAITYRLICDEFVELYGDRRFGDDPAVVTGFAKLGKYKVMLIGHHKGRNLKERTECCFGCAQSGRLSEGALEDAVGRQVRTVGRLLDRHAGAYPGVGAEERGQSQAIAENMFEMSRLETPIVVVVIGEGGSGGALGIGVGDRVAVMEHAYYSVISPEGCAGILWKSHEFAEQAASALRFTSQDLVQLGVVDEIIPEPLGGAHRDHHQAGANLKRFLIQSLRELVDQPRAETYSRPATTNFAHGPIPRGRIGRGNGRTVAGA